MNIFHFRFSSKSERDRLMNEQEQLRHQVISDLFPVSGQFQSLLTIGVLR
jgi:hypothetical protein